MWYLSPGSAVKAAAKTCPEGSKQTQFSVDGIELEMCTKFLSNPDFTAANPTDALQVASSFDPTDLQHEFSITAIPAGTSSPAEAFPTVHPAWGDTIYRLIQWFMRLIRGENPHFGPSLTVFGKSVPSIVSQIDVTVDPSKPEYSTLSEWITLAGDRLWIVRMSQKNESGKDLSAEAQADATSTLIWSDDLSQPSTSKAAANEVEKSVTPQAQTSSYGDLAVASWWKGACDTTNYYANSGRNAYPLGAVYRGMPACGPRPISDGGKDVTVQFFSGSWGEYEWECVELSMRFMYLNYGIKPYQANGNQVVSHYDGYNPIKILKVVTNGTKGIAPRPGDVLSYGPNSIYGHTSVVTTSSVDTSGNGSITIIEQNNSSTGQNTLSVTNWVVRSSMTVSGWLTPILGNKLYLPIVAN
jgi:hypothetical protein